MLGDVTLSPWFNQLRATFLSVKNQDFRTKIMKFCQSYVECCVCFQSGMTTRVPESSDVLRFDFLAKYPQMFLIFTQFS